MEKMILFQQQGSGTSFKWLTTTTNPDDDRLDMQSIGSHGVLYIAEIIEGIDDDVDNMILYIRSLDLKLIYQPHTDKFQKLWE